MILQPQISYSPQNDSVIKQRFTAFSVDAQTLALSISVKYYVDAFLKNGR